jgi:flagellar hook-length control protein FliK
MGDQIFSLAPAPVQAAPDNVASSGLVLSAAIGSSEWAADLGQQMVDMVTRGEQQVDPPASGRG